MAAGPRILDRQFCPVPHTFMAYRNFNAMQGLRTIVKQLKASYPGNLQLLLGQLQHPTCSTIPVNRSNGSRRIVIDILWSLRGFFFFFFLTTHYCTYRLHDSTRNPVHFPGPPWALSFECSTNGIEWSGEKILDEDIQRVPQFRKRAGIRE